MAKPTLKCPAGEVVHPVLSRNDADIQCRIQGGLQPAEGSKCCDAYTTCQIWVIAKQIDGSARSTKKQRDQVGAPLHKHVLS